ncbi:MAG: molybdenum cofactor biosynthesis F family protein [Acidobacteriota bacterium]|jgi:hypothetical protein|nr:molybdenum cofactor biosynthesis F family protein [Acidobacteriota bacterium]
MNIPMHRFKYTQLTPAQINQKLKTTEAGPTSASELSGVLSGKSLKLVLDGGLTLTYDFSGKNQLTLSENGGAKIKAAYGALTQKQGVFFSHLIPGQPKGYSVFIDQATNLVTVFEVWLCGDKVEKTLNGKEVGLDPREVQRQIHFGYVDKGGKAPETRHHLTNRWAGKGIHWTQDNGIETLELYTSVASSNFVELTRHVDDLGYCAPSDYILVDDNTFIYQRTEAEFSGISTLFVADLYAQTQVGVRLGFNEKDELEYYLFRGVGEVVGQLSYLEPFDDHGKGGMVVQAAGDPQAPGKGQRLVYRPVRDFQPMTDEEVHKVALKSTLAFGGGGGDAPQMMAGNNSPFTDMMVGKKLTIRLDGPVRPPSRTGQAPFSTTLRYDAGGPVRHYEFTEKFKLKYREDSESTWHEVDYRGYEADEKLFWFSHILADSKPRASVQVAVDLLNGLVTTIHSQMGTPYFGNETSYHAIFGVAEGIEGVEPPQYMRHQYTDELVGHAFSWSYSDQMTSMHVYTSPHSMTWTIFTGNQGMGAQWGSPCIFVKLRDGVYIFCQNEEACNGAEMIELINTKISHDCGFGFSGGAMGVSLSLTGAIGRHIGSFDIRKFYGPKVHKNKRGA